MAKTTEIRTLYKDADKQNIVYPVTSVKACYFNDGMTVEEKQKETDDKLNGLQIVAFGDPEFIHL